MELADGLSLPASAVNGLRRDALEQLSALRTAPPVRRENPAIPQEKGAFSAKEMRFTLSLARGGQLSSALLDLSPAIVYLPAERIREFDLAPYLGRGTEFCVSLPRICKDSEVPALRSLLEAARDRGCTAAAIQNIGQLELAGELGFLLRGDYGLNVFNSRSLAE